MDKNFGRYGSSVLEVSHLCVFEGNLQRNLRTAE